MAKDTTESSGNQLHLTIIALVALVAIVSLVALVMNSASVRTTTFSTGNKLVSADQAQIAKGNLAGNARAMMPPVDESPPQPADIESDVPAILPPTPPPTKCDATGNLAVGQTATYTVQKIEYEVSNIFRSTDGQTKFLINGEMSPALSVGSAFTTRSGLRLTVTPQLSRGRGTAFCLKKTDRAGIAPACNGVSTTLFWNEAKTYSMSGIDYEIVLENISSQFAGFSVNGEHAGVTSVGQTTEFTGTSIRVDELVVSAKDPRVGLATFCFEATNTTVPPINGSTNTTNSTACIDTDPSNDPYVRGEVIYSYGWTPDVCTFINNKWFVTDYYCNGDIGGSDTTLCPNGCSDGACTRNNTNTTVACQTYVTTNTPYNPLNSVTTFTGTQISHSSGGLETNCFYSPNTKTGSCLSTGQTWTISPTETWTVMSVVGTATNVNATSQYCYAT